jgi:hypothetical protein
VSVVLEPMAFGPTGRQRQHRVESIQG